MEVAGQWRREWAGTAEYGKVTEGGVTRRVARAMEVLHASAPGSRVRVMRAAYHSTAGPGAPAASFMLHSSRRVISSGSSFLESPTFMTKPLDSPTFRTKPLEISSLPLESSPERFSEAEDYKVTEPDDLDISEPSKWRSSSGNARAAAAPSEDSSSADTVSVIDLDVRNSASTNASISRKYSFDSDISEAQSFKKPASRLSPLLDAPVTLSTLKYKSLLNGTSSNWHDRRKSYSFEDTSPLNETIIHSNDTLAMESSTDSGICKSTEIVNEHTEDNNTAKFLKKDNLNSLQEGSFKEWLARNRATSIRRESPLRSQRGIRLEELGEDKISLQSPGKVSISIPIDNKIDDRFQYMKNHSNDDFDKRTKRVEFCKTELHFAAESGTVNIIATDEKPPPSNDFRKRRSAFVPMKGKFEKPITLFGEKVHEQSEVERYEICDKNDTYEYGSTTKSILKNKIPKPKPYLLGENMLLDRPQENDDSKREYIIPTTVSLINKQLQPEERKYIGLSAERIKQSVDIAAGVRNYHASRTTNQGPKTIEIQIENELKEKHQTEDNYTTAKIKPETVKQKLRNLETSPILQAKTRPLRESDLTYFGVRDHTNKTRGQTTKNRLPNLDSDLDDYFKSVKLIQKVSNSVCNSEAESEDHEYQNVPFRNKLSPVPLPTPRKHITKSNYFINPYNSDQSLLEDAPSGRVRIIKPVIDEGYQVKETRRSTTRRQDISTKISKNRSISEPPKHRIAELRESSYAQEIRRKEKHQNFSPVLKSSCNVIKEVPAIPKRVKSTEEEIPLYANASAEDSSETYNAPIPSRRSRVLANTAELAKPASDRKQPILVAVSERHSINSKSKIHNESEEIDRDKLQLTPVEKMVDSEVKSKKQKQTERSSPRNTSGFIDKRSTREHKTSQKQDVRSSSSRRLHTKERSEGKRRDINTQERKEMANNAVIKDTEMEANANRRERSKSKDNAVFKKESAEAMHSVQKKHSEKEKMHTNPKRNEYVINYDDKNGTVSSICKVKTGAPHRKINNKDKSKEYPRTNTKSPEKRNLLEYQDRHWIQNGYSDADRKRKNRLPMQRTCQIL